MNTEMMTQIAAMMAAAYITGKYEPEKADGFYARLAKAYAAGEGEGHENGAFETHVRENIEQIAQELAGLFVNIGYFEITEGIYGGIVPRVFQQTFTDGFIAEMRLGVRGGRYEFYPDRRKGYQEGAQAFIRVTRRAFEQAFEAVCN